MSLPELNSTRPMQRRNVLKAAGGIAGALALGSLVPSQNASAQEYSKEDQKKIQLVHQFYAPFSTGDTSIYKSILAVNWVNSPLAPGEVPGRDGFASVIKAYRTAFANLHATTEDILVTHDKVAVRSTLTGKHAGTFLGIAPTGLPVTFRTIDIHCIKNNLFVATWHLEDLLSVLTQLKAFPTHS